MIKLKPKKLTYARTMLWKRQGNKQVALVKKLIPRQGSLGQSKKKPWLIQTARFCSLCSRERRRRQVCRRKLLWRWGMETELQLHRERTAAAGRGSGRTATTVKKKRRKATNKRCFGRKLRVLKVFSSSFSWSACCWATMMENFCSSSSNSFLNPTFGFKKCQF